MKTLRALLLGFLLTFGAMPALAQEDCPDEDGMVVVQKDPPQSPVFVNDETTPAEPIVQERANFSAPDDSRTLHAVEQLRREVNSRRSDDSRALSAIQQLRRDLNSKKSSDEKFRATYKTDMTSVKTDITALKGDVKTLSEAAVAQQKYLSEELPKKQEEMVTTALQNQRAQFVKDIGYDPSKGSLLEQLGTRVKAEVAEGNKDRPTASQINGLFMTSIGVTVLGFLLLAVWIFLNSLGVKKSLDQKMEILRDAFARLFSHLDHQDDQAGHARFVYTPPPPPGGTP